MKRGLYPVTVLVLLLAPGVGSGQEAPPAGKAPEKQKKQVQVDPAREAWVKALTERIADRDDRISRSARLGLLAMGKDALPALKRIADGGDAATAEPARRLMAMIKKGARRGQALRRPGQGRPGLPGKKGFRGGPRRGQDLRGNPGHPGRRDFRRGPDHPGGRGLPPGRSLRGRPGEGHGQPPGKGVQGPQRRGRAAVARVLRGLDLSQDQKEKVREFLRAHRERAREMAKKGGEGLREKMKGDLKKGMKGILTDEQFKKLEKALDRAGTPGRRGPGPGRAGRGRRF